MEIKELCNLKNFHLLDNVDVIATSLFKMESGYKDFNKYTEHLESTKKTLNNVFPNSVIALFIDDSIKNDDDLYDKIKKLEGKKFVIIEYSCEKFRNKKIGHIELFGTLMRMLPFFDFPGNKTKSVASIDADMTDKEIHDFIRGYKIFKKLKTDYHYNTNILYSIFTKWSLEKDYDILAGKQFCRIKFPINILLEFLECVKSKTCDDYSIIRDKLNYTKYTVYPYGIDEYFLNYKLLPYMKQNNIKYSVMTKYEITAPLFYVKSIQNETIKYAIKELLEKIFGNIGDHRVLMKKFDNMFYMVKNDQLSNEQKIVAKKYYNQIEQLAKNNDYRLFDKKTLNIILLYKKKNIIEKTNVVVYEGNNLVKKYKIAS